MGTTRRGLFGGSFDPPHLGHVAAVRAALRELSLDSVVVTVANDPWHKGPAPTCDAATRLELAHAAFDGIDGVTVSAMEIERGGPTYTVDTVEALVRDDPDAQIVLIVGADAAAGLPSWHRADDLASLVTVAVVPRPGAEITSVAGFVTEQIPMAPVDLSSTSVRDALMRAENPATLVPDGVVRLILTNRLYSP